MKVNLAWLADLVDLPADRKQLFEAINTQLGEIETIENLSDKYKDALIAKVVRVADHPQAQRLKVCLIDDAGKQKEVERSEEGLIQVVCGADNVSEGMFACWLPPGSTVPQTFAKPSPEVLKAVEIRGVKSWGMLASAFELDLGGDREGILELSSDQDDRAGYPTVAINEKSAGQSLAVVFGLDTVILDIDNKMFTHRPDCFGLLGVAREVAAITQSTLKTPAWYGLPVKEKTVLKDEKLILDIETPQLASRFRAFIIEDLEVQPSDLSLQFRLASLGIKPVNNVVDWTNYLMYLTGQPTHAFDYDKLRQLSRSAEPLKLVVRQSRSGESLLLLNGKTLTFDQPALVIATDQKPVALAGVMGGSETEVGPDTKTALLECANFNMYDIWRTSMHYGGFSEAATRFTKGQSPLQIPPVALTAAEAIARSGSGRLQSQTYEFWEGDSNPAGSLPIHLDFISRRLGSNLAFQTVVDLLEKVGFEVTLKTEQVLEIKPPFWRTDIAIAEDIVEEIGRLNGGYQALEPVLPRRSIRAIGTSELLELKTRLRNCLASRGANEALAYSFVSAAQLQSNGQDVKDSFRLSNPLNPQLEVYRQSLTPSLIEIARANQRHGHKDFALFEIGCAHLKDPELVDGEGLPLDLERSALLCSAEPASNRPFYAARRYLDLVARRFKLEFDYRPFDSQSGLEPSLTAVYNLKQSALIRVNNTDLGIIGFLKSHPDLAAWEIKTDVLLQASRQPDPAFAYRAISKYPKSVQDLTLKAPLSCQYRSLKQVFNRVTDDYRKQNWQITWELVGIYQPPKNQAFKHLTFRWQLAHSQRTVAKTEVSKIMETLVEACQKQDAGIEQVV